MPTKPAIKARSKEVLWITSILLIVLSIAFYDILFLNKTFKVTTGNPQALRSGPYGQAHNKPKYFSVQSTDNCHTEENWYHFIKKSLKSGVLPLWNPHQICGYAFIGMMHVGLFWPLNFIFYLLPDPWMWDAMILSRLFLAGFLTFWYLRVIRITKWPALAGSIAYMLSGPMILAQWSFANVEILVPLVLLCMEQLLRNPNMIRSCNLGLSIGLMFLAGHPEHIFLDNVFAALYFMFRWFTLKPKLLTFKPFMFLLGGYLIALGLGAIVLLPFLQNWTTELWNFHPPTIGARTDGAGILSGTLINLIMPYFFQPGPVSGNFVRTSFWGHVGALPILFSIIGLRSRQRHGLNFFFLSMAFFLFAKSHLPLAWINWVGQLPLFNFYNFFHHSQHLFAFCLSIATALGARFLIVQKKIFLSFFLLSLILITLIGFCLIHYAHAPHFKFSLYSASFTISIMCTIVILIWAKESRRLTKRIVTLGLLGLLSIELIGLIPRDHVRRFDSFPPVPYIQAMQQQTPAPWRAYGTFATFYPNTATGYLVDDFGGEDAILPKRYVSFINNFIVPGYFEKKFATAFRFLPALFIPDARLYLNMLNVKYMIAPTNLQYIMPQHHPQFVPVTFYNNEVLVFDDVRAFPRAYIVHRAFFAPDENLAVTQLKRIKNYLAYAIVLQHPDDAKISEQLLQTPEHDDSTVIITQTSLHTISLKAKMEHAGFMVLSDAYHPDWQVFVDGKRQTIYLTNSLIRSVYLTAGAHKVEFRFVPMFFYIGVFISLATLCGVLLYLLRYRHTTHEAFVS